MNTWWLYSNWSHALKQLHCINLNLDFGGRGDSFESLSSNPSKRWLQRNQTKNLNERLACIVLLDDCIWDFFYSTGNHWIVNICVICSLYNNLLWTLISIKKLLLNQILCGVQQMVVGGFFLFLKCHAKTFLRLLLFLNFNNKAI